TPRLLRQFYGVARWQNGRRRSREDTASTRERVVDGISFTNAQDFLAIRLERTLERSRSIEPQLERATRRRIFEKQLFAMAARSPRRAVFATQRFRRASLRARPSASLW